MSDRQVGAQELEVVVTPEMVAAGAEVIECILEPSDSVYRHSSEAADLAVLVFQAMASFLGSQSNGVQCPSHNPQESEG